MHPGVRVVEGGWHRCRSTSLRVCLFKVVYACVLMCVQEGTEKLRELCMKHLARFINIREPNIRYLGLEAMSRMAALEGTGDEIRKQQAAIMVVVVCGGGQRWERGG